VLKRLLEQIAFFIEHAVFGSQFDRLTAPQFAAHDLGVELRAEGHDRKLIDDDPVRVPLKHLGDRHPLLAAASRW